MRNSSFLTVHCTDVFPRDFKGGGKGVAAPPKRDLDRGWEDGCLMDCFFRVSTRFKITLCLLMDRLTGWE